MCDQRAKERFLTKMQSVFRIKNKGSIPGVHCSGHKTKLCNLFPFPERSQHWQPTKAIVCSSIGTNFARNLFQKVYKEGGLTNLDFLIKLLPESTVSWHVIYNICPLPFIRCYYPDLHDLYKRIVIILKTHDNLKQYINYCNI